MSDTRISAADLLRLAAIAAVSPEGTADEVVAILQRTGPVEAEAADPIRPEQFSFVTAEPDKQASGLVSENEMIVGDAIAAARATDSDKFAKPE